MNSQRKLLQINTTANHGATGRIAEEIGQLAIAKGWESHIAYGRYERKSSSRLLKVGNDLDIALHGMQTRLFDRHGLGSAMATRALIKKINHIQPHIIHLHNIHGYYLNYKLLFDFLAETDVPVVWTLHDCWAFTGHCAYFSYVNCDKWKSLCDHCPQSRSYPASLCADRSRQNYLDKKSSFLKAEKLQIVCVSKWLASMVKDSFLSRFSCHMISNGVNTEVFAPMSDASEIRSKFGVGEKFLILGVANYWDERKGLRDFIALNRDIPDNSKILLVGLTRNQISKLPRNITGIERTDNAKELAALYSAADIYVNTSYEESFGMTTVEAMACGTPSVVYDSTASPELMTYDAGVVVPQGDISKLSAAIQDIMRKGKSFYTKACRQNVIMHYRKEERHLEYFNLYENLMNFTCL